MQFARSTRFYIWTDANTAAHLRGQVDVAVLTIIPFNSFGLTIVGPAEISCLHKAFKELNKWSFAVRGLSEAM